MQAMIHRNWPFLAMLGVLTLAALSYWPGLAGGFLFDDFVNLNAIGATGRVDDWPTFWRYVTSGTADPTGRPLALASFLIDARNWPADPGPFLRTNLVLHLINGALLFWLLRLLGRRLEPDQGRADATALLGTGLWLLHPLFVSTTLYIVQREAMLPATSTLLGLLAYVHGRNLFEQSRPRSGAAWMISGVVFGTFLGLLCKANGLLLPLLAWVLEATVLRAGPADPRSLRVLRLVLLVLPAIALLLFLASYLPKLTQPMVERPWTGLQRLLTEPRVLLDYLRLLVVPRSISSGLYNDAYLASTGVLHPWTTLPAIVAVLGLASWAWLFRVKYPVLSAAVLFYFAGHLLESTVVPLELYFEHRNYLPALLLFWPLGRGIVALRIPRRLRVVVGSALLLLFAATTYQRAVLWGQPQQLAVLWAKQNPDSSRAQATLAMYETGAGNPGAAMRRLGPLWQKRPDDLQIAFNYVDTACAGPGLVAEDARKVATALGNSDIARPLIRRWLGKAINVAASGQCPGLDLAVAEYWLESTLRNPELRSPHIRDRAIEPLLAQLAIRREQPELALAHYDRALAAFITPDVAAHQASMLASSGYYAQALEHLDSYERLKSHAHRPGAGMRRLHAKVLQMQGYWPREMAILRENLNAELRATQSPVPQNSNP